MRRQCACCSKTKDATGFPFKNKAEGKRHSYCFPCYRERNRKYHEENGDRNRARVRANHKKRRSIMIHKMFNYLLDKSCVHCKISDPRVLEFDHLKRHEKEHSISMLLRDAWSWEPVQKEIDKCRILCANCHRIHTAKQMGWKKHALAKAKRR